MKRSSSEVRLIKKAIAGDSGAFAELYDHHLDEVYRFVYFKVSDQVTAEDITSQVFLKAWSSIDRYQIRGAPFKAWLFQIARNQVIDHYRTQKETISLEPDGLMEPDPAVNVAGQVEKQLEFERIRDLFQHLTAEQREVLALKFINGLSTKEVARVMKKGQGAIRALQMRALQALSALLEESEDE